jgi:hypothetical protein
MMKKDFIISVFETVGKPLCVASSDGKKVYKRIVKALSEERHVVLSFHNVTILTSAFLNMAIGQLYGKFSEETVREFLKVQDISQDDLELLKLVVETAKAYFKNPLKFNKAIKESAES